MEITSVIRKTTLSLMTLLISSTCLAQLFCFYNPNTGPHYHNGSSGAIYDITTGDFNNDSHLDVVTANSVAANISFVPGYGNGALGSPDTTPLPSMLSCITSGDFNADGNLDVAAEGAGVYVLFGNGDGTFQPYTTYASGTTPSRIYYVDATYDNIPDLVSACANGIFILQGQLSGIFLPAIQYQTGGSVVDVTVADFDNDFIPDIVATTATSTITSELSFLKGNSNGTFVSSSTITTMTYPYNFIFGINSMDTDNDGNTDLIVSNLSNSVHRMEIYTGNGNGAFNSPSFYPVFYNPNYVYLADMDNDMRKDIVVVETGGFTVLKSYSNGTFSPYEHFISMPSPNGISIGDYDEDGRMDVIVPSGSFGSGLIGMNLNCFATGLKDNSNPEQTTAFPNPFQTSFTIETKKQFTNADLIIYDLPGKEVIRKKNISGAKIIVEGSGLPDGMYFYTLKEKNKLPVAGKVIKE